MNKNFFIRVVLISSVIVTALCSCDTEEHVLPVNDYVYNMSLRVVLSDYDAPTTRAGYDWPDGAKLYLQFVGTNKTILGYAKYVKGEDVWNVSTSEALTDISTAKCEAYYFKHFSESDATVVPLSESTVVYQDVDGEYTKSGNQLTVSLSLSPKTGRIRFKGEAGKQVVVRGLQKFSVYDALLNQFTSSSVELSLTVAEDGYTPYCYAEFPKSDRTISVVDGDLIFYKECSSVVLAAGKSGYMDIPTETQHSGWLVQDRFSFAAEAVDLGLSVKWASWNVGATKPEEYGGYYAWGETEEKKEYSQSTYLHYQSGYIDIGSNISATQYDVAHVKWGGGWRMPSYNEISELQTECSWKWTSINNVVGIKITGPNGKSIFLPAGGYRGGNGGIVDRSVDGFYFSSEIYSKFYVYTFYFNSDGRSVIYQNYSDRDVPYRYHGYSIRPVKDY